MINFSICLIIKEESKTLPRCIASLKEFMDRGGECVILDTGSKDNSVQIAKDLGCKVFEAGNKYQHTIDKELAEKINERFVVEGEKEIVKEGDKYFSFFEARNHCASLASNDWVCWIDADEVFTKLDIDEIEKVISDTSIAHLDYEFIFAHQPNGAPGLQFRQSKFYDRTKMRWENITHEILIPIGAGGVKYLPPDIFLLEHFQQPGDRHSYLAGLAVDCFTNETNDRNSHYLGREMMYHGRYKSAIKEFTRHTQMNGWIAEKAQSFIYIGDCYGFLNEPTQQCEYYFKAFHTDPHRRESLIKLARFYQHNNVPVSAAAFASAALQIPKNDYYANQQEDYEDVPHSIMYWALGWQGDIEGAKEHLLIANHFSPHNTQFIRDTKYYFDYAAADIQGWMSCEELMFLYETAKHYNSIVEIGSWHGKSTHAILTGCKGQVYAVDTWEGSLDERDATNWMAKQQDAFEIFKKNTQQFNNLTIIKKTSVEAANSFEDKSVEMVFIDASHDFDSVVADIRAWKNKATKVLCGHDWLPSTWMSVIDAVRQELGEPDEIHNTIWLFHVN